MKSITTKIGLNTDDFLKGLKSIDRELKKTEKTAKQLEKGLSLEFDEKRFTQAQKQVQAALKITDEKAQQLRKELKFLEEHGAVDTSGYKAIQAELAKAENEALQLNEQLERINKIKFDQAGKGFRDFGDKLEEA